MGFNSSKDSLEALGSRYPSQLCMCNKNILYDNSFKDEQDLLYNELQHCSSFENNSISLRLE